MRRRRFSRHITFYQQLQGGGLTEGHLHNGSQSFLSVAEVLTGGGWRAITRESGGVISGPGNMDYAHDMPPYVQEIADWLDDPARVHPCNGENAHKGFEIAMAMCRSAVQRGKIKLPLGPGEPELEALAGTLPD